MANFTHYKSRAEWLEARAKCVTSTETPALFGMSPYMTAFELANQKLNRIAVDEPTGDRIAWGTRLQNAIAQGIADDYGVQIEPLEWVFGTHPECPRLGASFDYRIVGTAFDPERHFQDLHALFEQHGPGLLEIKNVDALQFRDWPENDAPDHIEIQVQSQLEVAALPWSVLGVLVGGNRTEIYTRLRDKEVGRSIVSKVSEFWSNLDRGVLPSPLMPEDADIVIKLHQYAEPNKVFRDADQKLLDLCDEYVSAGEVAREAANAQKIIKADILQRIGDAERAIVPGFSLSATMVAECRVEAYTRSAYRNFRLLRSKSGKNQSAG